MGNHRADVEPLARPSEQVTAYVGRRCARPVEEPSVETAPAPYVGRRRAATGEPAALETQAGAPAAPVAVIDPVPTTTQLQALLEQPLDQTAPRPRVVGPLPGPSSSTAPAPVVSLPDPTATLPRLDLPLPRRPLLAADEREAATIVPVTASPSAGGPGVHDPAPLFVDDSRVDIPIVGLPADIADDRTVVLPLTSPGQPTGRRRAEGARVGQRRRLASLPVVAGVLSIAAVVTGVTTTGHAALAPASAEHVVQASALGGFSASGSIGAGAAGSHASLSRGGDRSNVASLLKQRNQALQQSNRSANAYDVQLAKNLWVLPIDAGQYQLTGRFGDVSGLWRTVHTGLDFACPTGTPIHAIANGTITFVGWDGAYGNKTVETLADGTEIWYAHQNTFGTQVGATVRQGQVIGYVGSTGNTTGPHVHIEVRPGGGDPVDPDPAFREHGVNPDASQ